jgi:hypothetical protein
MERVVNLPLQPGETVSISPLTMAEYAQKFMLSCRGNTCQTVKARISDPSVVIDVNVPDCETVGVSINGEVQTLSLNHGAGQLTVSTDQTGIFLIEPADRSRFCAAGNGSLCVEIVE